MAHPFNVVALFCEDIREEKRELRTLVGLLPDNIAVAPDRGSGTTAQVVQADATTVIGKLCVYVRLNVDPTFDLGSVGAYIVEASGRDVQMGILDPDTIAKAQKDALAAGSPLAGILFTVVMPSAGLPRIGTIRFEVEVHGERHLAGALNFREASPATTPTSSPPPS